jgi:hypothetical protein
MTVVVFVVSFSTVSGRVDEDTGDVIFVSVVLGTTVDVDGTGFTVNAFVTDVETSSKAVRNNCNNATGFVLGTIGTAEPIVREGENVKLDIEDRDVTSIVLPESRLVVEVWNGKKFPRFCNVVDNDVVTETKFGTELFVVLRNVVVVDACGPSVAILVPNPWAGYIDVCCASRIKESVVLVLVVDAEEEAAATVVSFSNDTDDGVNNTLLLFDDVAGTAS